MNNEQVNKVISEYMGYKYINYDDLPEIQHISGSSIQDIEGGLLYRGNHFTLSIDSLIPVWHRLKCDIQIEQEICPEDGLLGYEVGILDHTINQYSGTFQSIQEAAAHATAKAILALGEK